MVEFPAEAVENFCWAVRLAAGANPHAGKALKDELAGLRSFRIGHVRIVYRIAASRFCRDWAA